MMSKITIGCFLLFCYVAVSVNGKTVPITPNLKNLNKDFLSREGGGSAKPKQGTVATPAVKPGAVSSLAVSALKPGIVAAPPRDSKPAVATPPAVPSRPASIPTIVVTPPQETKPVRVETPVPAKPAIVATPLPTAKPAPGLTKSSITPAPAKAVASPAPRPSNVKDLINYYDAKSKPSYSDAVRNGKKIEITPAVKSINKEFLAREREFSIRHRTIYVLSLFNNSNEIKVSSIGPKPSPTITAKAVETTHANAILAKGVPQPPAASTDPAAPPSSAKQTVAENPPVVSTPPPVPAEEKTTHHHVQICRGSNVQELISYFDTK